MKKILVVVFAVVVMLGAAQVNAQVPYVQVYFDEFWQGTLKEQEAVPLDLQIEKVRDEAAHTVHKFNFAGLLGLRCYGWLTIPKDASRKWPGVLVLPPAGEEKARVLATRALAGKLGLLQEYRGLYDIEFF